MQFDVEVVEGDEIGCLEERNEVGVIQSGRVVELPLNVDQERKGRHGVLFHQFELFLLGAVPPHGVFLDRNHERVLRCHL